MVLLQLLLVKGLLLTSSALTILPHLSTTLVLVLPGAGHLSRVFLTRAASLPPGVVGMARVLVNPSFLNQLDLSVVLLVASVSTLLRYIFLLLFR